MHMYLAVDINFHSQLHSTFLTVQRQHIHTSSLVYSLNRMIFRYTVTVFPVSLLLLVSECQYFWCST